MQFSIINNRENVRTSKFWQKPKGKNKFFPEYLSPKKGFD